MATPTPPQKNKLQLDFQKGGNECNREQTDQLHFLTFLLVKRWQDAVVSAHFEIDLLLHTIRDGTLWNNYTDSCLNGAQDATVGIEDTSSCCHNCVALIFILIIIQGTGAGEQIPLLSCFHIQWIDAHLFYSQAVFVTSQGWLWELR